jgi:hypothetical protein
MVAYNEYRSSGFSALGFEGAFYERERVLSIAKLFNLLAI